MITENMDLKEIRKALGLELFLRRQQKGMSLFHMAHHIKIDRRVLDRAETGRPVPLYTCRDTALSSPAIESVFCSRSDPIWNRE